MVEDASRPRIPHELNDAMSVSIRFIFTIEGSITLNFHFFKLSDLGDAFETSKFTC